MITMFVRINRVAVQLSFIMSVSSGFLASCGEQSSPVLQSPKLKAERVESEALSAKSLSSVRSNSSDESEAGDSTISTRVEVFSKKIEPLTLQKGGSARIALPFTVDTRTMGLMRSVEFVSSSAGLKDSSVQGKSLNVVVSDDATEGRHDGRVVVRFENGAEYSQPLAISVLP